MLGGRGVQGVEKRMGMLVVVGGRSADGLVWGCGWARSIDRATEGWMGPAIIPHGSRWCLECARFPSVIVKALEEPSPTSQRLGHMAAIDHLWQPLMSSHTCMR
jgi:hypothetical protein